MPITRDELFGNQLGLDPAIKEKIEAQGLDCRFISVKHLQDMGGTHQNGWRPIKMKDVCDNMDGHTKLFGADPDGFIRRGDLVLGVRSKELGERHKQYLAQEAERVSLKKLQRAHKEELRRALRETNEQVVDGFDEGDEE
jgi:hypothetical protein